MNGCSSRKRGFVDGQHCLPMLVDARVLAETQLLRFEIPVTEIMPEEIPKSLSRFVVAMVFESSRRHIPGVFKTLEDPLVFRCI